MLVKTQRICSILRATAFELMNCAYLSDLDERFHRGDRAVTTSVEAAPKSGLVNWRMRVERQKS